MFDALILINCHAKVIVKKKMKKLHLNFSDNLIAQLLTLICISLYCLTTHAQTKENDWQGAYAQLGLLGFASYIPGTSSGTTSIGSLNLPTTSSANTLNGYAGNISAGYNFPINGSYVLGIGATLFPGTSRTGTTSATNAAGTVTGEYNLSNVFSIFISPGYVIDSEKLLYGKLGYAGSTIRTSASGNRAGNFSQVTTSMNGVVFGLGYKQIVMDSIYLFAEANYAINNDKSASVVTDEGFVVSSTAKATGFDLMFGVGYRF